MINLLPYNQRKIIDRIRALKVANTTLVVLVVLGIVGGFLLMPTLITINNRYELTQAQVGALQEQGMITNPVDIQSFDRRTVELEKKLAVPVTSSPTELIASLRNLANANVMLSGFTYAAGDTPKLTVAGIAKTREALQAYIETLKGQPTIASVDSPITNYVKSKDADFAIVVVFKK